MARRFKAGLSGARALRDAVRFEGLTFEVAGAKFGGYSKQSAHRAVSGFEKRFRLKLTDPSPEKDELGREIPPFDPAAIPLETTKAPLS